MRLFSLLQKHGRGIASAYDKREVQDEQLTASMGVDLDAWGREQRRQNHAKLLASPGFLRDIDDVEYVHIVTCICGKPMIVRLTGNGRVSSMWLNCCGGGQGVHDEELPVRSFTSY